MIANGRCECSAPEPNMVPTQREGSMKENRVKRILSEGGLALGTHVGGIADPQIVEIIGLAGFDAAFIDMEHTTYDPARCAARGYGGRAYRDHADSAHTRFRPGLHSAAVGHGCAGHPGTACQQRRDCP